MNQSNVRLNVADRVDTKELLLDSAERLFAEHGFTGTSLRAITQAAGANLAAVNYHFGSKDGLIRAVFRRRLVPLNQQRVALLEAAEAKGVPDVAAVIRAFFAPVTAAIVSQPRDSAGWSFARLMSRVGMNPSDATREIVLEELGETIHRFVRALAAARPDLPLPELLWRFHFAIGAFAQTLGGCDLLETFTQGACRVRDAEEVTERLVSWAAAGFEAPVLSQFLTKQEAANG
jgi:AcrR family transcriptional regulator